VAQIIKTYACHFQVIAVANLHHAGAHGCFPEAMFKFLDGPDTAFPSQPRDGNYFPLTPLIRPDFCLTESSRLRRVRLPEVCESQRFLLRHRGVWF
jgi:hypothetical protein